MHCRLILAILSAVVLTQRATAAASKCQLSKVAEFVVTMDGNRPLIPARINGRDVFFLLDTGAASTFLFVDTMTAFDLPHRDVANESVGVGGLSGMRSATIDDLTLDKLHLRGKPFRVVGNPAKSSSGLFVAGALGTDFWHHYDIDFNLAENAVSLFKPHDCDRASLAYWSSDYSAADFAFSFSEFHPHVVVPVKINGQPVKALLDSGAASSFLTLESAKKAGIGPDSPGVTPMGPIHGIGRKQIPVWLAKFDSLELGEETIKNIKMRFGDLFDQEEYGTSLQGIGLIIGVDFLKAHHLMMSYSQEKLYYTYNGGRVFDDQTHIGDTGQSSP